MLAFVLDIHFICRTRSYITMPLQPAASVCRLTHQVRAQHHAYTGVLTPHALSGAGIPFSFSFFLW